MLSNESSVSASAETRAFRADLRMHFRRTRKLRLGLVCGGRLVSLLPTAEKGGLILNVHTITVVGVTETVVHQANTPPGLERCRQLVRSHRSATLTSHLYHTRYFEYLNRRGCRDRAGIACL